MIGTILLLFSMNGQPAEVSERLFDSLDECKEFVETLVQQDNVLNSDYGFYFRTGDGYFFKGQCISVGDYNLMMRENWEPDTK